MDDTTGTHAAVGASAGHLPKARRRRTLVAGVAGSIGVAGLAVSAPSLLEQAPPPPEIAALPLAVQVLLIIGNPLLFTWIAAWAGGRFAPGAGLRFHAADAAVRGHRAALRAMLNAMQRDGPAALVAGGLLGAGTALADRFVFARLLGPAWREVIAGRGIPDAAGAATALLYGGITEEVMLRWGVLTAIAVLFRRIARGPSDGTRTTPAAARAGVMGAAIFASALLFAAGHLPAAVALGPLDAAATSRILVLNAAGGVLFGWMFWRRGLEAAIVSHMAAHAGMWAVASAMR